VVYGFLNYKTHAKISTVVRREGRELKTYTHYGTGNYHPITARFYTDLSLFTCDPALGRDATRVFNYLSGYAQPERLENLSISPLNLKSTLLERIRLLLVVWWLAQRRRLEEPCTIRLDPEAFGLVDGGKPLFRARMSWPNPPGDSGGTMLR